MQPTLQMSDAYDAPLSSMTSGAIQYGVPMTSTPLWSFSLDAIPKSAILMSPVFVTKMFAHLMSRCTTPCSCRNLRPSNTWPMYTAARFSGNRPNFFTIRSSDPFSTYSITMLNVRAVARYVMYCTIFGWFSDRNNSISAMMLLISSFGTPCSRTCLIATKLPPSTCNPW